MPDAMPAANFGELPFQRLSGNSEWAPFWVPKGLPNGAKRRLWSTFCATKPAPTHPSSYFPDSLSRDCLETPYRLHYEVLRIYGTGQKAPFWTLRATKNARLHTSSDFPETVSG